MEERKGIVTMGGNPVTLVGPELKIGDKAPNFTVLNNDLSSYSLEDAGDSIKIISVVPSLDTPVCDLQTTEFNKRASEIEGVKILTISMDLPFAQARFCGAKDIDQVITLSDHNMADFGSKYGFLMKELRLLARGVVVLDRDNTIKYVELVPEATNAIDHESALEAANSLK